MYDPYKDGGFRLYSREAGCFLATSFRTYPNTHGRRTNDSISHTLNLEIETCCSTAPAHTAATFYVVDGKISLSQVNNKKLTAQEFQNNHFNQTIFQCSPQNTKLSLGL